MPFPKFNLPSLPEDMAAHDGSDADAVTSTETDPFQAYIYVYKPDGGFDVVQNRRKLDRRLVWRRQEDKDAEMERYVDALERNREIVARGWAMFAMGFSAGVVMILAFMYLTS